MSWNFILSLLIFLSPPKSTPVSGSLWWNCGMRSLWHDGNFPNDLHRIQRQKIEEATRQLVSTERHCETLQMQLDSALKEMEPLKKRKQELEESQQKCKEEVEEARDRIRASEGLCQQYREVIKKFEDEEAEREASNSNEKKVSAAKLQEDLTKVKADLASEKRKNRGLERELDRAKVMMEGLREQISSVQQQGKFRIQYCT
ncbi:microfibrillar-associated protein 1-like isoform X3 [Branchiostoma lanceolatum]|uniref:microfibrillar-associated protein 1-like isoform X3 n=1 Tax=Branchiostoma lanceolatum TaxID=7740 RepID=UPI003456CB46